MIFDCNLNPDSKPMMPQIPELNQTDVKWISIDKLTTIRLIPDIAEAIINYTKDNRNIELIEDR